MPTLRLTLDELVAAVNLRVDGVHASALGPDQIVLTDRYGERRRVPAADVHVVGFTLIIDPPDSNR